MSKVSKNVYTLNNPTSVQKVTVTPLVDIDVYEAIEAMGFLPGWVIGASEQTEKTLLEFMDDSYPYGDLANSGMEGAVTEEGVYQYPGDPDLPPIIRVDVGGDHFYFYQYAIVAFSHPDGYKIARMD